MEAPQPSRDGAGGLTWRSSLPMLTDANRLEKLYGAGQAIIFDVAIIASCIVSLVLLALAFLFE